MEESNTIGGKDKLFNKWHWEKKMDYLKKKNQVNPHNFKPYTKINCRQIRNPILKSDI